MSSFNFQMDLSKFCQKTQIRVRDAFIKITYEIFSDVVYATPVDTGRARGNWFPSWGSPIEITTDETDKSGSKTMDNIMNTLLQAPVGQNLSVFLTNSLDYINKLEYGLYPSPSKTGKTVGGYSIQAPQGMVRVTLEAWKTSARYADIGFSQ